MSKKRVLLLAEKYGASVLDNPGDAICVEAPFRHVWSCDDLHELVGAYGDGAPKAEAWADLARRMAYGIEPCREQICEWCADGPGWADATGYEVVQRPQAKAQGVPS